MCVFYVQVIIFTYLPFFPSSNRGRHVERSLMKSKKRMSSAPPRSGGSSNNSSVSRWADKSLASFISSSGGSLGSNNQAISPVGVGNNTFQRLNLSGSSVVTASQNVTLRRSSGFKSPSSGAPFAKDFD